jgi:hypothetical protein
MDDELTGANPQVLVNAQLGDRPAVVLRMKVYPQNKGQQKDSDENCRDGREAWAYHALLSARRVKPGPSHEHSRCDASGHFKNR